MTRRSLLLAQFAASAKQETPRNKVARTGNAFIGQWRVWADLLNAQPPEIINTAQVDAFYRLPAMFRAVEKAMREYLKP